MTTRYRIQRDPLDVLDPQDLRGRRPARWTIYRGVPFRFRPSQCIWFQAGPRHTTHAGAIRALQTHLKAAAARDAVKAVRG